MTGSLSGGTGRLFVMTGELSGGTGPLLVMTGELSDGTGRLACIPGERFAVFRLVFGDAGAVVFCGKRVVGAACFTGHDTLYNLLFSCLHIVIIWHDC